MNSNGAEPRKTKRVYQSDPQPAAGRPDHSAPQQGSPSLDDLHAEFAALAASNQAAFAALAAQGTSPDPFYLVHARINHLIDSIAQFAGPNGALWAMMTRLGFEQSIASDLAKAGPATVRMQLADGGRYTPEMVAALARQAGTLRTQ